MVLNSEIIGYINVFLSTDDVKTLRLTTRDICYSVSRLLSYSVIVDKEDVQIDQLINRYGSVTGVKMRRLIIDIPIPVREDIQSLTLLGCSVNSASKLLEYLSSFSNLKHLVIKDIEITKNNISSTTKDDLIVDNHPWVFHELQTMTYGRSLINESKHIKSKRKFSNSSNENMIDLLKLLLKCCTWNLKYLELEGIGESPSCHNCCKSGSNLSHVGNC